MPLDRNAIEAALRVLSSITNRKHPDEADVEQLRRLAPDLSGIPIDDVACTIIRRSVDRANEG